MSNITTAEKIETIVMSYLTGRTTEGTMGSLVDVPAYENEACSSPACYRVEADGKTVIVRSGAHGWEVRFGPMVGVDPELYVAASLALDVTWKTNVSRLDAHLKEKP